MSPQEIQALAVSPISSSAAIGGPTHAAVAAASLATLAGLVGSGPPERRGFHSIGEAQGTTLAAWLPVFMVGLDDLGAYQTGQDPRTLLLDPREVMYPITVNGEVRSSVFLRQRADGFWEIVRFGGGNVAAVVDAGRQVLSTNRGIAQTEVSLIVIPTLAARLLGHDENGSLMLTPVYDVPGTAFHAGETHSASDVFAVLQPLAAQYPNGH